MPVDRAEQQIFYLHEDRKVEKLLELLKQNDDRTLIFCRTKRGVDKLATQIGRTIRGITRLHSDREQCFRDEAMAGFRSGKYRILMATDIAARGIDVADIEHVINFDFPHAADDYIHRIGRTARVAATGKATSFVTPHEHRYLRDVQRLMEIPIVNLTDEDLSAPPRASHATGSGHGGPRRRSGFGRKRKTRA
jgi:ATP-dependent RNA helicase RhlE